MSRQSLKRARWLEIGIDRNAMRAGSEVGDASSPQAGTSSPEILAQMQLQVASYIEEISLELGAMARAARLDSLAYFIDMTSLEAEITRRACQAQASTAEAESKDTTYE